MSACQQLTESATAGVQPALRAVDCVSNEATQRAFAGLFGSGGHLAPALHILLTLYIGFFAVSLLTGRSRIGISALTPRMMTLGLVLTFATSWLAYQSVVWNLAVGAPDQLAGLLTGAKGSATQMFGQRIDMVFAAIADAASSAGEPAQPAGEGATAAASSFTPANMMWLSGLMLLLGTVGILIAARIALAVLLLLGPVFIVMALFGGTRGLFAGWVRGVAMTALAPLFVVLGGGIILELAIPVLASMSGGGEIDGRAAVALFVVAAVHLALMAMVLRVLAAMVGGWSVFGLAPDQAAEGRSAGFQGGHGGVAAVTLPVAPPAQARSFARPGGADMVPVPVSIDAAPAPASASVSRAVIAPEAAAQTHSLPPLPRQRARGVGSRFAAPINTPREMIR